MIKDAGLEAGSGRDGEEKQDTDPVLSPSSDSISEDSLLIAANPTAVYGSLPWRKQRSDMGWRICSPAAATTTFMKLPSAAPRQTGSSA